jgi:hypothetical protein
VCPYSYILAHGVEEAGDEGLVEVERLLFGLRSAPAALSEPGGEYIRDHWRDHVYELAQNNGVEIHIPQIRPRHKEGVVRRLAVRSAASPFFGEGAERQGERRAGPDLVMRGVTRGARGRGGPRQRGDLGGCMEIGSDPRLRPVRQAALGIGVRGAATIATRKEVLYSGVASPGKIQALLAKW